MIAFVWTGIAILMFRHVTGHSIYAIKSNASMLFSPAGDAPRPFYPAVRVLS